MSSNTPPLTIHSNASHGGVDGLEWSLAAYWGQGWSSNRQLLYDARNLAEKNYGDGKSASNLVQLGEHDVFVEPTGRVMGKPGKGPFYPLWIKSQGMDMLIQHSMYPPDDGYNVRIIAPGMACLRHGFQWCLDHGRSLVREACGEIGREALGRVDEALDLPGMDVDPFFHAVRDGRYVTRSKADESLQSYSRSVRIGRPPLSLIIYDKLAQVQQKQNTELLELMKARRWNGTIPKAATRVEFQIRRAKLREFGIDDPSSYLRKRADMLDYLTNKWIRFTAGPVDRRNTSRAVVLPEWAAVAAGFAALAGRPLGMPLAPLPRGPVDDGLLLKQMYGVLRRVARNNELVPIGYDAFRDLVMDGAMHSVDKEENAPKAHIGT